MWFKVDGIFLSNHILSNKKRKKQLAKMNQGMSNLILLANYQLPAAKDSKNQNVLLLWRGGVVGIITVQLHSTMPELSLCAGSNPARNVSKIGDGEDLCQ